MKKFEIFPHTADIGIRVYGRNLKELFNNAGEGVIYLMREEENLIEKEIYDFNINANFVELLLNKFLNEFVYLFDTKGFLAKRFKIEDFHEDRVVGKIFGEIYDKNRHKLKYIIKSCTLEDMIIENVNSLLKVDIIFDI